MALVLLKVFDAPGEAQVAKVTLEAHDIPAFVFEEHNPYPGLGLFAARLMVSEDDLDQAGRLLDV